MIYISEETKRQFIERRNDIGICPCCNSNIKDRPLSIHKGLVTGLYKVCKWAQQNKQVVFTMDDIKDILDKTQYARFGDWKWIDGIMEKKQEYYKINLENCAAFFKGDLEIPLHIKINQITGEVVEKTMGKVSDVKKIEEWLQGENKLYNPNINPYK